jgi:hypothetical protein
MREMKKYNLAAVMLSITACSIFAVMMASCSYKAENFYENLPEGRERDSLKHLYLNSMTYGTVLRAKTDTLALFTEPSIEATKSEPLEKGTVLTVVDFTQTPTKTNDVWGNPTTLDVTYAKVSYDGNEGWMLPTLLNANTDPNNWTRFLPDKLGKKGTWLLLGTSLLVAIAYFIFKRKTRTEEKPLAIFFPSILYALNVLLAIGWLGMMWDGKSWNLFLENFWSWSLHPFMGKMFLVSALAVVPVLIITLYEIWLNTRPSVGKMVIHIVGVLAMCVMMWAAVMVSYIMFMVAFMLIFAGATVAARGGSGGNTCPRCGHTWVKSQSYQCPNCGMV